MTLFHLVLRDEWDAARVRGSYAPASLEREGFIHFSTDRQLVRSANRFFAGRDDVLVISVREDRLRADVRYEAADGESFPHLYGALDLEAVVEVLPMPRGPDGQFEVPEKWRAWAPYFR